MRAYGTGTIQETSSGKFRGRLPGRYAKALPSRATREEAQKDLDIALHLIRTEGLKPSPAGTILGPWGRSVLTGRHLQGYSNALREISRWTTRVEESDVGRSTVEGLTRPQVVAWVRAMSTSRAKPGRGHKPKRKQLLSRSVVVDSLRILRAVMKEAILQGLRTDDPTEGVEVPRAPGRIVEPWTYLRPGEVVRLLDVGRTATVERDLGGLPGQDGARGRRAVPLVHPEHLDAAIVALYTGLRSGELWTLHLRDVDLAAGRIVVRYGGREGPKLRATKGRKPRVLALLPPALAAVQRQIERLTTPLPDGADPQLARCSACGRSQRSHVELRPTACGTFRREGPQLRPNPAGLLFPSLSHHRPAYRSPSEPPACWRAWLAAAGLTPEDRPGEHPVTWHTLRHTFATLALAGRLPGCEGEGWRLERVSAYLGHKSIAITQRYADVAELLL